MNWSKVELCTQKEGEPKVLNAFIQTFQKRTALNPETPEHRNLLISSLVRNLPNIGRQIQNGVVGCAGQSLNVIIEVAIYQCYY